MYPRSDILLVSLGTGLIHQRIPYKSERAWGLFKWAQPIMKVVFDGVNRSVDTHLAQLLREDRYFRFQVELQQGSMDDATPWNIRELRLRAEYILYHDKARIEELCALLGTGRSSDRRGRDDLEVTRVHSMHVGHRPRLLGYGTGNTAGDTQSLGDRDLGARSPHGPGPYPPLGLHASYQASAVGGGRRGPCGNGVGPRACSVRPGLGNHRSRGGVSDT